MISFICGIKKNDTNELIYKTEIVSQTEKTDLWLPKGKGWGEGLIRNLGLKYIHPTTYKIDNQQGPTV